MPDGEDFLWAPVLAHLCLYESVVDGTLDLGDMALMNDLLRVRAENQNRADKAAVARSREKSKT